MSPAFTRAVRLILGNQGIGYSDSNAQMLLERAWEPIRGDDLPLELSLSVFDAAAHHGPVMASYWLRESVGFTPGDGIGNDVIEEIARRGAATVFVEFNARRFAFLTRLAEWQERSLDLARRMARLHVQTRKMLEPFPAP